MSTYVVTFFKNILSSDGHQFKCLQEEVCIHKAKTIDRAVEAAEHRFERHGKIPDWTLHADILELKIDGQQVRFVPKPDKNANARYLKYIPGAGGHVGKPALGQ